MTPDKLLLEHLRRHGITGDSADPAAAWAGFKDFARELFRQPGVALLFQVGDFGSWYFDPVCQFEVLDAEGEHDHYEQTHCEMTAEATPELKGIDRNLWSFDFGSADDFFKAVEELPEYHAALSLPSYSLNVRHEAV